MQNIVGKRIQEARRKSKPVLSRTELLVRLELEGWKLSRVTLAKIETGTRRVTDFEVVALSRALKVSTDWLLDKDLYEVTSKRKRRRLVNGSTKAKK